MGTDFHEHRSEVDREEADRLWKSVTEIDEKVGVIDKSVATLTSEVHGLGRGMVQLGTTVNKVAEDFARSSRELLDEINKSKTPNWQAFAVIGPTLGGIIMAASFVFYREIDHARREIDHVSHVQNLKNQHQDEIRKSELATVRAEFSNNR